MVKKKRKRKRKRKNANVKRTAKKKIANAKSATKKSPTTEQILPVMMTAMEGTGVKEATGTEKGATERVEKMKAKGEGETTKAPATEMIQVMTIRTALVPETKVATNHLAAKIQATEVAKNRARKTPATPHPLLPLQENQHLLHLQEVPVNRHHHHRRLPQEDPANHHHHRLPHQEAPAIQVAPTNLRPHHLHPPSTMKSSRWTRTSGGRMTMTTHWVVIKLEG
ncbi:hypothetical protein [Lacunimicrobium album]